MKVTVVRSASLAGIALVAMLPTTASAAAAQDLSTSGSVAAPCPAARVTGLSALLDTLSTGSSAGPSIVYGGALAVVSQPLPEPLGGVQAQFLSQGAQGVQDFSTQSPQQINAAREVIAPLAAGNDVANQGVDAFADGLDTAATSGGKAIAPGDLTLRQIAVLARVAREGAPKPCS